MKSTRWEKYQLRNTEKHTVLHPGIQRWVREASPWWNIVYVVPNSKVISNITWRSCFKPLTLKRVIWMRVSVDKWLDRDKGWNPRWCFPFVFNHCTAQEGRPVPIHGGVLVGPRSPHLVALLLQLLWPAQPSFKLTVALRQPTHLEGLGIRSHPSALASAFPPTENSERELPIYNVSLLRASQR